MFDIQSTFVFTILITALKFTSMTLAQISCPPHCQSCTPRLGCWVCEPGYGKTSEGNCESCANNCASCVTSGKCDICKEGHRLNNDKTCSPCSENCLSCVISGEGQCDICLTGYKLSNGACFQGSVTSWATIVSPVLSTKNSNNEVMSTAIIRSSTTTIMFLTTQATNSDFQVTTTLDAIDKLNIVQIIAPTIAGIVILLAIALVIFLVLRHKKRKQERENCRMSRTMQNCAEAGQMSNQRSVPISNILPGKSEMGESEYNYYTEIPNYHKIKEYSGDKKSTQPAPEYAKPNSYKTPIPNVNSTQNSKKKERSTQINGNKQTDLVYDLKDKNTKEYSGDKKSSQPAPEYAKPNSYKMPIPNVNYILNSKKKERSTHINGNKQIDLVYDPKDKNTEKKLSENNTETPKCTMNSKIENPCIEKVNTPPHSYMALNKDIYKEDDRAYSKLDAQERYFATTNNNLYSAEVNTMDKKI